MLPNSPVVISAQGMAGNPGFFRWSCGTDSQRSKKPCAHYSKLSLSFERSYCPAVRVSSVSGNSFAICCLPTRTIALLSIVAVESVPLLCRGPDGSLRSEICVGFGKHQRLGRRVESGSDRAGPEPVAGLDPKAPKSALPVM